ncbi:hypothetical protein ACFL35_21560, partial [Candidatus Riflebacteria bacterium]
RNLNIIGKLLCSLSSSVKSFFKIFLLLGTILLHPGLPASADFSRFENLKKADDFIYKLMHKMEARIHEFKVENPILEENHKSYPVSLAFQTCLTEKIPKLLRFMESFKPVMISFRPLALSLSPTGMIQPEDGRVFVSCHMFFNLNQGPGVKKLPSILKRNLLKSILKKTGFKPGVSRAGKALGVAHWLTNLRIDSDNRMSVSAITFKTKDVFSFCKFLQKEKGSSSIFLSQFTAGRMSKRPIWRFEISTGPTSNTEGSEGLIQALESLVEKTLTPGVHLYSVRISPPIRSTGKKQFPLEIDFKKLEDNQWEPIKEKLSEFSFQGFTIGNVGELSTGSSAYESRVRLNLLSSGL